MTKKVLVILLLFTMLLPSIPSFAMGSPCADIIDTKQNIVIKSVQVNSEINNIVSSWVNSIDNFCGKISPLTVEGYKVRVTLNPPVEMHKKSLTAKVNEVYIIVPQNKPPFLIIYEDKNKPSYFKFHGNIDNLSKALGFNLRNK
ncbi:hypothetical protein [Candidatus Clostridium stratigraminis]|uniref:Uncharacterized protein n=1 Tax=Candidatus Clostridium stratigraminis TaxID=3381661 RepID=A0ABW8SYY9_9CLOT